MYAAGGTQNYYPVVSSSLRGSAAAAAAATSFPFAAAAASHAYYGNDLVRVISQISKVSLSLFLYFSLLPLRKKITVIVILRFGKND